MGPDVPAKDIEDLLDKTMNKLTPIRICIDALTSYTRKFIYLLILLLLGAISLTVWLFDSEITLIGFDFFDISMLFYVIGAIMLFEKHS